MGALFRRGPATWQHLNRNIKQDRERAIQLSEERISKRHSNARVLRPIWSVLQGEHRSQDAWSPREKVSSEVRSKVQGWTARPYQPWWVGESKGAT